MLASLFCGFVVLVLADCHRVYHVDTSPLVVRKFHHHEHVKAEGNNATGKDPNSIKRLPKGDIISLIKKVDQRVTNLAEVVIRNQKNTLKMLKQLTWEVRQYREVVYYPKGTRDYSASRHYQGASFVGYGNDNGCQEFVVRHNISTPERCVQLCKEKREEDGTAWSGISWFYSGQHKEDCVCTKNEQGHIENTLRLHYKFE